jgi:hypothetical protein
LYRVLNKLIFILPLFFLSCKINENNYSTIIQTADRIKVIRSEIDFDTTIIIDKSFLKSFQEIFKNDEGNCSCTPKEEILFYDGSKLLLRVAASQNAKDCVFLITGNGEKRKCYRLNYRIGMFLSEKIQK